MKRIVFIEYMLLVLMALVVTWVITEYMYQNIMLTAKTSELKSLLCVAQQIPRSETTQIPDKLKAVQGSIDAQIRIFSGTQKSGDPSEVVSAIQKDYGESVLDRGILNGSGVAVAGKLSDGSIIDLYSEISESWFTLWSVLPALLLAAVISYILSGRLVTNIGFVFNGVASTLERAGNEGGITVKPSPEILEYNEFREQAREIAELSTLVSQRIKTLFVENKRIDYLAQ